ncbi:SixA phosphatase family protein [Cesiribacter andamanensis]|uniref:Phosphohistidine phosphatase n=1 Tax=Cesiribacter andamanensis AMV16 TaxID=1279009 RepID=M7NI52_9BACT|nr:histidine phosphatase family protein [Cesiribacter andamanensis]EMR01485.1 phosphohistidine phosphatase [Cesiribacter andamanensis AMV16]
MKTLYLLRHAKSSWDDPSLGDHERPLNERGIKDGPKMGKWLSDNLEAPQLILCSDSVRTRQTIAPIMEAWQLPADRLKLDSRLYHAHSTALWKLVRECDASIDRLLLVGHNPGLTDFANRLSPQFRTENIPTCGFVAVSFAVEDWQQAREDEATFETYQYPKNL